MSFNPALVTSAFGFQDGYQTTLANSMTDSQTTCELTSLPTPTEGTLVIEPGTDNEEEIYYTSKGTGLVNIPSAVQGRGVNGTAHAHNAGVTVKMLVTKASMDGEKYVLLNNGVSQFWATLSASGYDLTTQATTVLANNSAYTVTKIAGNSAGTSATSGVTKILGGFYFEAPRTGSYEIKVDASIRLGGATGPYGGWIYITQDTTNPTQNADGVSDTGTAIKAFVTTISGGAYLDTACLSGAITVSLTAGTTYYFTMQTKWASQAGTTPTVVAVGDQGQISTMTIKELSRV